MNNLNKEQREHLAEALKIIQELGEEVIGGSSIRMFSRALCELGLTIEMIDKNIENIGYVTRRNLPIDELPTTTGIGIFTVANDVTSYESLG